MAKSKGGDPARFYGAPVPAAARKLSTERLTYATDTRLALVDAHLKSNYAYFGSLDKTLAGFYILDDEGDDYTLLDLRETNGQVYFLDHDELELTVRFDSLAAYVTWRAARDAARKRAAKHDDDDGDVPLPKRPKPRGRRKPSTPMLWFRYRTFVWLLTQPGQVDEADAVETALAQMAGASQYRRAFELECRQLARDPHLAIYWLVHFTCTGQDAERDRVVAALRGSKHELVRAFVATFGAMGDDGTLAAVPSWRSRRSRFIFALAPQISKRPFALYLKAFAIDPVERGLEKALAVWTHAKSAADREQIRACVAAKQVKGPGADYLRTELALLDGTPRPAEWLLDHDPYHSRFLELALAGGGGRAVEQRLAESKQLDELLEQLDTAIRTASAKAKTQADLDKGQAPALQRIARAPKQLRDLAARRIIHQYEHYTDVAIAHAYEILRAPMANDAGLARKVVHAIMHMLGYEVVKTLVKRARKGVDDAIALLWSLIQFDERRANEYHAQYVKEFALDALGTRLLEPQRFTAWIALLDRPGLERLTSQTYSKQLSPWEKKTSLLKKLSPAQRHELAFAMTAKPPRSPHSDPPRTVVQAVHSPALAKKLRATLARTGDRKRIKRYEKMIAD